MATENVNKIGYAIVIAAILIGGGFGLGYVFNRYVHLYDVQSADEQPEQLNGTMSRQGQDTSSKTEEFVNVPKKEVVVIEEAEPVKADPVAVPRVKERKNTATTVRKSALAADESVKSANAKNPELANGSGKAQLYNAKRMMDQYERKLDEGTISKSEYDKARSTYQQVVNNHETVIRSSSDPVIENINYNTTPSSVKVDNSVDINQYHAVRTNKDEVIYLE